MLPLRDCVSVELRDQLERSRLERAIGVIYKPETELESHYFQARLTGQFDELIWFDETSAVTPLKTSESTDRQTRLAVRRIPQSSERFVRL